MKKNIKKIGVIGLSVVMILGLVACGSAKDTGDLTEQNSVQNSEQNLEQNSEQNSVQNSEQNSEQTVAYLEENSENTETESEIVASGDVRNTSIKDIAKIVSNAVEKSELGQSYMEENPNGVTCGSSRLSYEEKYIHDNIYGTIENRDNGLVALAEIRVSPKVGNVEKNHISIKIYELKPDSENYNLVHSNQNFSVYAVSNLNDILEAADYVEDKMDWDSAVITPEEVIVDFYNGQYAMNISVYNYKAELLDWKTSDLDLQPAIDAFMSVE